MLTDKNKNKHDCKLKFHGFQRRFSDYFKTMILSFFEIPVKLNAHINVKFYLSIKFDLCFISHN